MHFNLDVRIKVEFQAHAHIIYVCACVCMWLCLGVCVCVCVCVRARDGAAMCTHARARRRACARVRTRMLAWVGADLYVSPRSGRHFWNRRHRHPHRHWHRPPRVLRAEAWGRSAWPTALLLRQPSRLSRDCEWSVRRSYCGAVRSGDAETFHFLTESGAALATEWVLVPPPLPRSLLQSPPRLRALLSSSPPGLHRLPYPPRRSQAACVNTVRNALSAPWWTPRRRGVGLGEHPRGGSRTRPPGPVCVGSEPRDGWLRH